MGNTLYSEEALGLGTLLAAVELDTQREIKETWHFSQQFEIHQFHSCCENWQFARSSRPLSGHETHDQDLQNEI